MNWKVAILGGLAYYVVAFIVSMATGGWIHEGVLEASYIATESFWRPELRQDPPDIGALMPLWITTGLVTSFILAAIYDVFRKALAGAAWQQGLKFGIAVWLLHTSLSAAWSGVFNLPYDIWTWWAVEGLIYTLAGATVLGIVAEKLAPTGD